MAQTAWEMSEVEVEGSLGPTLPFLVHLWLHPASHLWWHTSQGNQLEL